MNRILHLLFTVLIVSCSFRVEAKISQHQEHVNTLSNLIGSLGEDLLLNSGVLTESSKVEIINHSSIHIQKVDSSKKLGYDGVSLTSYYSLLDNLFEHHYSEYSPFESNYKPKLYKVFCNYRL